METRVELLLRPRLQSLEPHRLPHGPDGFRSTRHPPEGCASVFRTEEGSGACWFRDQRDARCAIHRELGEPALPSACRHFPRVCVLEPDGVSVSLSHYCPTAAALLFDGNPDFAVVDQPPAFPSTWPFEGLDTREAYSPLLRSGVLLGFDGLRTLEDEAVRVLGMNDVCAGLERIERAIEVVRGWSPSHGSIVDWIRHSFENTPPVAAKIPAADPRDLLLAIRTPGAPGSSSLPAFTARVASRSTQTDLALRKYLAARLIAAWVTFQADDLRSVGRLLRLCLDSVFLFKGDASRAEDGEDRWKEAIRSADLWILHYADPERLARRLR